MSEPTRDPVLNMICPYGADEIQKQARIATFMELPPQAKQGKLPFILQHHWRGKSVHWDFRIKIDKHAIGWTLLDNPTVDKPPTTKDEARRLADTLDWTFKPKPGMDNKKLRAVPKAKQPVEWLGVEGEVKPGGVGATEHGPGYFYIVDRGTATFGSQKPYFYEYFLHGAKFKDLRIVVRGVRLPRLDPETKRPIEGKYNLVWNAWIPADPTPYAVSKRAKRENWYPPKNFIPIPAYWREKHKKEFNEWLKRAKEHWRSRKALLKSSGIYTLHEHKWIRLGRTGEPVGRRKIPQREWLLHLQTTGKPRTWRLSDNPLWALPVAAVYEGRTSTRWLSYEGTLEPREAWNPNKRLKSKMVILARGAAEIEAQRVDREEVISIRATSGRLKGRWVLSQEEPGSDVYTLDRSKVAKLQTKFVLHHHSYEGGADYDIRVDRDTYLDEWASKVDPRKLKRETEVRRKRCEDRTWLTFEGRRAVRGIMTTAKILDRGDVDIIEDLPHFVSMRFHGRTLRGLYHLISRETKWYFGPSELPAIRKALKIEEKPTRIIVHLHDIRHFSSCEPEGKVGRYDAPAPPAGAMLRICAYPRPRTIHGVKIQALIFPKPKFTVEQIRGMDFSRWQRWEATQIRGGSP